MTSNELIKATAVLPAMRRMLLPTDRGGLDWTAAVLESNLQLHVKSALNAVSMAHEWDFSTKSDNSVTTVIDTTTYTMTGDDSNCQQVISINYGDDETPITFVTQTKLREILSYSTPVAFQYWVVEGRGIDNSPRVKIVGTPNSAETLTYRFYLSDVDIADFPNSLDTVLVYSLARMFFPKAFAGAYRTALAEAITSLERGTGNPRQGQMDSTIRLGNIQRSALNEGL